METIELQLDTQTLEFARRLAESRHCSLEELIKEVIEHLGVAETASDPWVGMFADAPDLIDKVIASAMQAREEHPLRQSGE